VPLRHVAQMSSGSVVRSDFRAKQRYFCVIFAMNSAEGARRNKRGAYQCESKRLTADSKTFRAAQRIVELAFSSKELRTVCESQSQALSELGLLAAESLKHRLADLRAAVTVKDLIAGRPRLASDGEFMILDLKDEKCIKFKANHTQEPRTDAGVLDWNKVTRIKLIGIEDIHG
jgi:hypothetical protein